MTEMESRMQKVRRLQLAQLEVIRIFKEVCDSEGLTYFMLGGTMLGAVRHKGFIPWDDDVDMGLPRPDYERFLQVVQKYLPQWIWLEAAGKTKKFNRYFARLKTEKAKLRRMNYSSKCIEYAWIDVFPLDGAPADRVLSEQHEKTILKLRKLFGIANFDVAISLKRAKTRAWYKEAVVQLFRLIPLYRLLPKMVIWKLLDKTLKKYNYEEAAVVGNLTGRHRLKEAFPKEVYGEGRMYDFEGMKLRGPSEPEIYLRQMYGDYLRYPPENKRNDHQTEILMDMPE